jgi:hypothetical protein
MSPYFFNRFPVSGWAPRPIRSIVGCGFWEYGLAKLSEGPVWKCPSSDRVPAPPIPAWLTVLLEIAGGLAVTAAGAQFGINNNDSESNSRRTEAITNMQSFNVYERLYLRDYPNRWSRANYTYMIASTAVWCRI